jgi:hypothetical protein
VSAGVFDVNVNYVNSQFGSVPKDWSVVQRDIHNQVARITTSRVDELSINVAVPVSLFELTFPVGTSLVDENNRDLVVAENGEFRPATFAAPTTNRKLPLFWINLAICAVLLGALAYRKVRNT